MKNGLIRTFFFVAIFCVTIFSTMSARAFALLGPFQPWMEETNGFRQLGDIGGPMDIGDGYRWNVPVITYGFDQSFLDYFGTNGVQAVESAIQILNDLPSASDIVLTNYPFNSMNVNYAAQAQGFYDLKSRTLSLLVEHLGLASSTRYIYALNGWNPDLFGYSSGQFQASFSGMPPNFNEYVSYPYSDWGTNILFFLIGRNFDPTTFAWSPYINNTFHVGLVYSWLAGSNGPTGENNVESFNPDPYANVNPSVADFFLDGAPENDAGLFYNNLTCDDVGGLAYLYSSNNINFETVLPDVQVVNTNFITFTTNIISRGRGRQLSLITLITNIITLEHGRRFGPHGLPFKVLLPHNKNIVVVTNIVTSTNVLVNGAWRPGMEKITFVRQLSGVQPGLFLTMTNQYKDIYISNGIVMNQQLQRITTQPDILFCAGDTGSQWFDRTGTTNWVNNSFLNGNTNGEGPGVIVPPVKITFNKLGLLVYTSDSGSETINQSWASFDGSTNLPIVYPQGVQPNQLTVQFFFLDTDFSPAIEITNQIFNLNVPIGGTAALQISTDQINWTSLATVTNAGSVIQWDYDGSDNPVKFFQVISQ